MTQITERIAHMADMLPEQDQRLAYELIRKLVLAWDPDFTKLTPTEARELAEARAEIARGETIPASEIDWDNLSPDDL